MFQVMILRVSQASIWFELLAGRAVPTDHIRQEKYFCLIFQPLRIT